MILLVLLLIAIVFALGLVVKMLLWAALGLFVLWIFGWWAKRAGSTWYLW